jgi:hypothetical protein
MKGLTMAQEMTPKQVAAMANLYPCSVLPANPFKGQTKTVTIDGVTAVMVFSGSDWMKTVTLAVSELPVAQSPAGPTPVAPSLNESPVRDF